MNINLPIPNIPAIMPEIVLTTGICLLIIIDLFLSQEKKEKIGILSIIVLVITMLYTKGIAGKEVLTFSNMFIVDNYALFFKFVFLIIALLSIMLSLLYIQIEDINWGEYYCLILFATLGMMIITSGSDLISIYVGIELMALPLYVLAGFIKRDTKSIEAALKYFLLGAFSSGIILYGIALFYGLTGTTNLKGIADYLTTHQIISNPAVIFSLILMIAGFGFKIAAVPFHMWAPDVYEGAPTSITAFMSVGPKAAAFSALVRVFMVGFPLLKPHWEILIWVLAVFTMTIGNIVAIVQTNIKRMLAYSSIAQAGYILIGLIAGNEIGLASILLYILVYSFMNLGAFAVIILLCRKGERGDKIEDFTGLATTNPYSAIALLIFFLSLTGIPPTAGFVGKFYIFAAAIDAGYIWLAVVGVLNSTVSLYYYFQVVRAMYLKDTSATQRTLSFSPAIMVALLFMVVITLVIGIYPGPFIDVAKLSVSSIL